MWPLETHLQGVGDSSKRGGFVPVLSGLRSQILVAVTSRNYMVSRETQQSNPQRMQEKKDIKRDLKKGKNDDFDCWWK